MSNFDDDDSNVGIYPDDDAGPTEDSSEYETLRIMHKFKRFYERKLEEIDSLGGGDCLELKLNIQEKWIEDLTEQTEMMARIVKELEDEATDRVKKLEDKLQQTSKHANEVMKRYHTYSFTHNLDEPFQKVFYLENDLKNLLEFVRRIRDDGRWTIDGLQFYDITYSDLFGNKQNSNDVPKNDTLCKCPQQRANQTADKNEENHKAAETSVNMKNLSEKLKMKAEEYENLKQTMLDMRNALTEEVACKHDMLSTLRKDIQQLEERCLQSDKQTAFKDDIIKELRKEIKQLKQQFDSRCGKKLQDLEDQICCLQCQNSDLKSKLDEACKELNKRPTVSSVCTMAGDDLGKCCSKKEKELEDSLTAAKCKIDDLQCRCRDLESSVNNAKDRAENLQRAVDLYLNSINVLEAAEERSKIQIEQQKITITNLQEALVGVKMELDELRENQQQEVEGIKKLNHILYINLLDSEGKTEETYKELTQITQFYMGLQDSNFDLEIEQLNNLQDLTILETQLAKYQSELKASEECKGPSRNEIKKLRQAKRCYEHVIDCFKQEMAVMSEQLIHLQEILCLSNQSCKEENDNLYSVICDLQALSDRLNCELKESEKQNLFENQMNQLKDAKIEELQQIICQKNSELNLHDQAINEIKCRLENTVIENHELHATVVSLNSTIMQLQCTMQSCEVERCKRVSTCKSDINVFQKSIGNFKDDLQKRHKKMEKLQSECAKQHEMFKMAQKELDKNKQKLKNTKKQNDELQKKLANSEINSQQLREEIANVREQTTQMAQRDSSREQELTQYKQMAIELRQTLIELNESLAESQVDKMCMAEEIMKKKALDERQKEDLYLSCRCEIALYRKLAENFKKSLTHSEKKLSDMQKCNKKTCEELKVKDAQICELRKKVARREQEMTSFAQEANEKMKLVQDEKRRLCEMIDYMKIELQKKMCDKSKDKSNVQLMRTQEEVTYLRNEMKNMIQNQLSLNAENDKLLAQVSRLQCLITPLEEKNRLLSEKLDNLKDDKERLKCEYDELDKTNKEIKEASENIEAELEETKNYQDDMCDESKCVLNTVRLWLEEQRKINQQVRKNRKNPEGKDNPRACSMKEQSSPTQNNDYEEASKQNHDDLLIRDAELEYPRQGFMPRKFKKRECPEERIKPSGTTRPKRGPVERFNTEKVSQPPCPSYRSPWNLGSQGTDSLIDRESPRDSPTSFATCSVEEWYAPNYKDEDDTDYQEEEFIRRIETMTNDLKNSNKKLKYKCQDCNRVSKDRK